MFPNSASAQSKNFCLVLTLAPDKGSLKLLLNACLNRDVNFCSFGEQETQQGP